MPLACWNALKKTHLCSWARDRVDGEYSRARGQGPSAVMRTATCRQESSLSPCPTLVLKATLSVFKRLSLSILTCALPLLPDALFTDGTCERHLLAPPFEFYDTLFKERAKMHPGGTGPGGWDNVWLLSDPKVRVTGGWV